MLEFSKHISLHEKKPSGWCYDNSKIASQKYNLNCKLPVHWNPYSSVVWDPTCLFIWAWVLFFFFFKGDSRCSSALLIITNRWQSLAKYKIHSQYLSEVIWRPTQSFSKTKTMKLVVRLSVVVCFYICFLLQSLLQSEICLFMEWLRLEETVRITEFQPPCCQQVCQPLDQAVQDLILFFVFQTWIAAPL